MIVFKRLVYTCQDTSDTVNFTLLNLHQMHTNYTVISLNFNTLANSFNTSFLNIQFYHHFCNLLFLRIDIQKQSLCIFEKSHCLVKWVLIMLRYWHIELFQIIYQPQLSFRCVMQLYEEIAGLSGGRITVVFLFHNCMGPLV